MRSAVPYRTAFVYLLFSHIILASPVSRPDEPVLFDLDEAPAFDTSPLTITPTCHDSDRGPNSPQTAMSWLRLMAWNKLPLVGSYDVGEYIVCMRDLSPNPHTVERSGICVLTSTRTVTPAQVKQGLQALVDAYCKVCGTWGAVEVKWVADRRGCEGVCKRDIGEEVAELRVE